MKRMGMAGAGVLAMAVLLAGCSSAGSSPVPSGAATSAPTVAATAVSGAVGLFTGSDRCRDTSAAVASPEPNVTYVTCDRTATDPRMNGSLVGTSRDVGSDPEITTIYGSLTLTNGGGRWDCTEIIMGSVLNGTGGRDQVCTGSGGYLGLTAFVYSISGDTAVTWGVLGWIEATP